MSDSSLPVTIGDVSLNWLSKVIPLKENETLIGFKYEKAVCKGENFTSNLYRVLVTKSNNEAVSVIIKMTSESPSLRNIFSVIEFFPREIFGYKTYIPFLESEMGLTLGPELYFGEMDDDVGVLVMEDLKPQYKMNPKKISMGFEECSEVIKLMAQIHAIGHKFLTKSGGHALYDNIGQAQFPEMMVQGMQLVKKTILDNIVKFFPEFMPYYKSIEERYAGDMQKVFFSSYEGVSKGFRTYIQGDMWNNNILLRRLDNGKIDVRLIDWQITRHESGVKELNYFIYTSTSPTFRAQNMEKLKHLYLDTYRHHLGVTSDDPRYSWEEFEKEHESLSQFRITVSILFSKTIFDDEFAEVYDVNCSDLEGLFESFELSDLNKSTLLRIREVVQEFIDIGEIHRDSE